MDAHLLRARWLSYVVLTACPTQTSVPLDQVRGIAVCRGSAWRTGGLIAGILALPFVVIVTACALDSDSTTTTAIPQINQTYSARM